MTKTLKIEGMKCPMCEAHAKKALEAIEGVAKAEPSHTAGNAVVTLTADVANEVLEKAVADAGYKVVGIQ